MFSTIATLYPPPSISPPPFHHFFRFLSPEQRRLFSEDSRSSSRRAEFSSCTGKFLVDFFFNQMTSEMSITNRNRWWISDDILVNCWCRGCPFCSEGKILTSQMSKKKNDWYTGISRIGIVLMRISGLEQNPRVVFL